MRLSELAGAKNEVELNTSREAMVNGIAHDSRSVRPGDLFVCLVGEKFDGHRYAMDALARGATALCVQRGTTIELPEAPLLVVADTRLALPELSASVYGNPTLDMTMVGVTGTNGKTTTALLMASILRASGLRTGTIGTLGAELMGDAIPSERTTPEADVLQGLLAEMRARGGQAVSMEVSSHALAQHRTDGCAFDAAIFTNLTQDHLDYHGDMEAYFEAKLRLFRDYPRQTGKTFSASVNVDDPHGARVAAATAGRVLTYSVDAPSDVRARDVSIEPASLRFVADTPMGHVSARLRIGGAFQVYNALGAIGAAVGLGLSLEAIEAGLAGLESVPGRFEAVPTGQDFHVVVDYAHTPDGLENLLASARRLNPTRLIVVFGCGGDRDRTKRPIMGRIAAEGADLIVVTSDNPRTEDPDAIIAEILPGLTEASARVEVEPDRRAAISLALRQAKPGDLVLVAGKGHEDYQEVQGVRHHFDDREVVRAILASS